LLPGKTNSALFTSEADLAYLRFAIGGEPNRQTQNHNQHLFWHKIRETAMPGPDRSGQIGHTRSYRGVSGEVAQCGRQQENPASVSITTWLVLKARDLIRGALAPA
jgi:hypothetical protein